MGQLKNLVANLSIRQRIFIIAAAVLVAAGLMAFTHWRTERDFRPLYTNLSAEDAGAVIARLKETGTEYRVSENGSTVLAPSARVAELRLQFAAAGLPKTGRAGFELFDKANFGVTDFAEHINYRRALEGELERSIMALTEVEQARVHVTFPKDSVFLDARQPAKASVMLKLKLGAKLAPANVMAVAHLVSSAVEGLAPDAVSVLDMNGNLLSRPKRPSTDGEQSSEAALEYKQQIEKDFLAKIGATLEPVLGPEKFRAGVSVECDFSGGEQTDESFDPSRSVMTNSVKTEDISGFNSSSGVPGTASSLPRPTSRPGSAGSGMTRRTENISYQTSRTVKHVRLPQGTVKRISAAVLVDQGLRWEGTGSKARRILEPPSPEKLKTIRDVVAAAIGFDANRGDQLILETLPFESTLSIEPPSGPAPPAPPAPPFGLPPWLSQLMAQKNALAIAGGAGAGLMLLFAAAFLLLKKKRARNRVEMAALLAQTSDRAALGSGDNPAERAQRELEAKLAEQASLKQKLEAEALRALKIPTASTKKSEVLTKHIAEAVNKDPSAAAQILRSWLYDTDR